MKRMMILSFLFVFHFTGYAQKEPPQIVEVSNNLYAISGLGGNVAFLVTDEGVLVVDAGNSPNDGNTIVNIIKAKTEKPIRYLVLTHYHPDHTNGMQAFPSDVISIGQSNILYNLQTRKPLNLKEAIDERLPGTIKKIKKNLAQLKASNNPDLEQEEKKLAAAEAQLDELKTIRIISPTKTFEKDTTLVLGGDTVELFYPGPAHTKCNLVVYFWNRHVLHTGDLVFHDMFPFIAWQDGSDTKNWVEFLNRVARNWQIEKVIPGHGTLTDKEGLANAAEYLADLRAEVGKAIHEGKSLDEMKKTITMQQYKNFGRPHGLQQNIESVYHEMKK